MPSSSVTSESSPSSHSSESPKRALICTYLPMNEGAGVERFVLLLSKALQRTGVQVEVIDISRAGIRNQYLRRIRYFCAWKVGVLANKMARDDDIIVCNNFFSWNVRRRRTIAVFHGTDAGRLKAAREDIGTLRRLAIGVIGRRLERRTAEGRTVVAVSDAAREEIERWYGQKVDAVIPNAVDLRLFCPPADKYAIRKRLGLPIDKFLILFVGTTDPRKGLNWILTQLKPMLRRDQELVLRVDFEEHLEGTTIVGRLTIQDLADLYRSCDVLLFPTHYEGCSFGLIEALASGLPVITTPAGSGRDLQEVNELRPYVVDGRDCAKYIHCLNELQSSQEEWNRVSAACRALAERNHNLSKFESCYVDLVKKVSSEP